MARARTIGLIEVMLEINEKDVLYDFLVNSDYPDRLADLIEELGNL